MDQRVVRSATIVRTRYSSCHRSPASRRRQPSPPPRVSLACGSALCAAVRVKIESAHHAFCDRTLGVHAGHASALSVLVAEIRRAQALYGARKYQGWSEHPMSEKAVHNKHRRRGQRAVHTAAPGLERSTARWWVLLNKRSLRFCHALYVWRQARYLKRSSRFFLP